MFGPHRQIELGTGRKPVFIKACTSAGAARKVYEILNALSHDLVNFNNSFSFDRKHVVAHSAPTGGLSYKTDKRRRGNDKMAIYWRLKNGIAFVDSMYDIDKYLRKDWPSISITRAASRLDLPPKLDAAEMIVESLDEYNITDMLFYNARQRLGPGLPGAA